MSAWLAFLAGCLIGSVFFGLWGFRARCYWYREAWEAQLERDHYRGRVSILENTLKELRGDLEVPFSIEPPDAPADLQASDTERARRAALAVVEETKDQGSDSTKR